MVDLSCMCASFRRASRALTQMYDTELRREGLRATQFTILQALTLAGEVTQGRLAGNSGYRQYDTDANAKDHAARGMGEHATRRGQKGVEAGPDEGGRGHVQAGATGVGTDTEETAQAHREWRVGAVDEADKRIGACSYRKRRAMTTKTNYGRVVAVLIGLWFVAALTVSALHVFARNPDRPPLALLVAVLTPITIFTVWYLRSKSFQQYILSLNPRALTLVHTWRLAGIVFLVLSTYKILPEILALPAGWGDIAIGATALPVALLLARPEHKTSFHRVAGVGSDRSGIGYHSWSWRRDLLIRRGLLTFRLCRWLSCR